MPRNGKDKPLDEFINRAGSFIREDLHIVRVFALTFFKK